MRWYGWLRRARCVFLILLAAVASAGDPPGQLPWGGRDDRKSIARALHTGSIAEAVAAVQAAMRARGTWLGCPESPVEWRPARPEEPTRAAIAAAWSAQIRPALARIPIDRPLPARAWGYLALGAFAAGRAGQPVDEEAWGRLIGNAIGQQYADTNAVWPPQRTPGLFAYAVFATEDPRFDRTRVGSSVMGRVLLDLAERHSQLAVVYDAGPWSGTRFIIADVDPPNMLDGGAAYDHGIAGVAVLAAALRETDAERRDRWLDAARLACAWARAEPAVVNANYTAKLVWLLAEAYAAEGRREDREAMLDKLARVVLPGVLMDADGDGAVDGVPGVRFADLWQGARTPGRMWDAHNAKPVYHAMVAQAVMAAWRSLRDRGDAAEAARIEPYARAMLDNLSTEINAYGVPDSGRGLIPWALAEGLAAFATVTPPAWREALARLWGAGVFAGPGEATPALGRLLGGIRLDPVAHP
jgi:hypothetical protein